MFRLLTLHRASKAIRHAQGLSRADMLALQEQRWRAMARHAYATSPYYRRQLAGLDLERCALTDIPVLTKAALLENWDEIVADPRLHRRALEKYLDDPNHWGRLLAGRWMIARTSGTSGSSLIIPHEISAVDWNHAANAVRRSPTSTQSITPKSSSLFKRPIVACLLCSSAPTISLALLKTRPWIGTLLIDYRPISITAPWQEVLDQLEQMKPDVLAGYASVIGRLALAKLDGTLKIDLPNPGGFISTGGDSLTPGIRELCRQAFGIEPVNGYGCGETLGLARQLPGMEHMLVYEDLAVLEAVDENDQETSEDKLSDHVLVTPLLNKALPLLRYRLDDRIRFGPGEPGQPFKVIRELSGRSTMTYTFQVPEKMLFVGTKFVTVVEHLPQVNLYQFRQTGPSAIEGLFVMQPGIDHAGMQSQLEASMRSCLDDGGCSKVSVQVRFVPHLEPDPITGKVEQNVPLK